MTKIEGKYDSLPANFKDQQSREAYNDFSQKDGLATLAFFENKYSCSGFCDIPLFFYSKSLSEGPPGEDCAQAVIKDLTDNVEIAIMSLLAAITFWMAALAAIPNCCGANKTYDKNGKHVELSEDLSTMVDTVREEGIVSNRNSQRSRA